MTTLRLPKPFTQDELEILYGAAASRPDVEAAMRFLHETGLRSAEALSITTAEAQTWNAPVGSWPRRHVAPVFLRVVGKGDKERVCVISSEAQSAAAALLGFRSSNGRSGFLVPWGARSLHYVIAELGKCAGVPAWPHRFRHTFAQEHANAGTPIEVLADMMGHASVNTTRLYFASSETVRLEALERVAAYRRR